MYKAANKLLFRNEESPLPTGENRLVADSFNIFFMDKVTGIMDYLSGLPETNVDHLYIESDYGTDHRFEHFCEISIDDANKIMSSLATKSCELDPMPTRIIKSNEKHLLPAITHIINASLREGTFPEELKEAVVRPLIKKIGLDIMDKKNFRPVSNLPFLGKLLEKVVCSQLLQHIDKTGNTEKYQSAYTKNCSTETALLDVMNKTHQEIDKGRVILLIMLDLSAAFDTVVHDLLLNRLKYRFGINGVVWNWFQSYLKARRQKVVVNGVFSNEGLVDVGVPQGSILGPFLFTLFISPIGDICRKFNINIHSYADDQQIYCSLDPRSDQETTETVKNLQDCIEEIRNWMRVNRLKLNDNKTEFIMLGNQSKIDKLKHLTIRVGQDEVEPKKSVRNLGFQLNSTLHVRDHVSKICSSAYLTLKKMNRVKYWIDKDTKKILSQALVMSKVDYCNSLLLGCPKSELMRLQSIQNMCARFITGLHKYEHITPTLQALHWLKVPNRVEYKVLVLIFKCLNGVCPRYLSDELNTEHNRSLRSSSVGNLPVPKCRLSRTLKSCFIYAAPRLCMQ